MSTEETDLWGMAKPPSFSGREDEWTEWSFVMRSYMMVQLDDAQTLIDAAESTAEADLSMDNITQTVGASQQGRCSTCWS